MRAIISVLVLLFSLCGAQSHSTQTEVQTESQSTPGDSAAAAVTTQLDVFAELRELRDMVVEQRVLLAVTQNELQNTKAELNKMEAENALLATRLGTTETDMEHMKKDTAAQHTDLTTIKTEVLNLIKDNAAQEAELVVLKARLNTSETQVENLRKDAKGQEAEMASVKIRLTAGESVLTDMEMENAAQEAELMTLKTKLAATETDVVNLEKEITEKPKVAFSAGLTNGHVQAGNTNLNLVFTKIITNVGQAYSSTTGFFTAPVKGVYYFRFTVMDIDLISPWLTIRMCKNGQQVMYLSNYDTDPYRLHLSSGVTLQLEVGDVVNMQLPANMRLFDDTNRSIFNGFLLFPL